MTQAPPATALNGSRLVRFLAALAVADVEVSHKHFAERLGRLIDLPDSIALASIHGRLATTKCQPDTGMALSRESAIEAFLTARAAMMQAIVECFTPVAGVSRSNLPRVDANTAAKEVASHERYQLFYANQQREIALKVEQLRATIRAVLPGRSARLARLAVLDATLAETLSAPTQRLFAEVPRLLGRRFQVLYKRHQQAIAGQAVEDDRQLWNEPGGWLEQFTAELRGALLAELDARLQPVIGLLEALDEEVDRT